MQQFHTDKQGINSFISAATNLLGAGIKPLKDRDLQELLELDINQRPVVRIKVTVDGVTGVYEECDLGAFVAFMELLELGQRADVDFEELTIIQRGFGTHPEIRLLDLGKVPLSSQLYRLTGDHYSALAFSNEDIGGGVVAVGVIIHRRTGVRFLVPGPALN